MIFWFVVLLISLAVVRLMAPPILRALRGEDDGGAVNAKMRVAALAGICLAPLAAALIYLEVGAPESLSPGFQATIVEAPPDPRAEIAALPEEERAAMIESMVSGLAARLAVEPNDPEGWRMLARSYGMLNRAEDSAAAYRELVARDESANRDDWRNFALSLLALGDGAVNNEAHLALTKLLTFDQEDALALFYLGLAARERGDRVEALQHWRKLVAVLPQDAPILPQVHGMINELAGEDG